MGIVIGLLVVNELAVPVDSLSLVKCDGFNSMERFAFHQPSDDNRIDEIRHIQRVVNG